MRHVICHLSFGHDCCRKIPANELVHLVFATIKSRRVSSYDNLYGCAPRAPSTTFLDHWSSEREYSADLRTTETVEKTSCRDRTTRQATEQHDKRPNDTTSDRNTAASTAVLSQQSPNLSRREHTGLAWHVQVLSNVWSVRRLACERQLKRQMILGEVPAVQLIQRRCRRTACNFRQTQVDAAEVNQMICLSVDRPLYHISDSAHARL
jgi:hypothetical protein